MAYKFSPIVEKLRAESKQVYSQVASRWDQSDWETRYAHSVQYTAYERCVAIAEHAELEAKISELEVQLEATEHLSNTRKNERDGYRDAGRTVREELASAEDHIRRLSEGEFVEQDNKASAWDELSKHIDGYTLSSSSDPAEMYRDFYESVRLETIYIAKTYNLLEKEDEA